MMLSCILSFWIPINCVRMEISKCLCEYWNFEYNFFSFIFESKLSVDLFINQIGHTRVYQIQYENINKFDLTIW